MKTSTLLEKAQAVLMERGLAKEILEDGAGGPVCAVGAISVAICGSAWGAPGDAMRPARLLLEAANSLKPTHKYMLVALVEFNNAPETTLADVLQAFDAGIAYARAQEGGK